MLITVVLFLKAWGGTIGAALNVLGAILTFNGVRIALSDAKRLEQPTDVKTLEDIGAPELLAETERKAVERVAERTRASRWALVGLICFILGFLFQAIADPSAITAAIPSENTDTLTDLLKVWAVLGPLLAAAISQLWSRHVQKEDREYLESISDKNDRINHGRKLADWHRDRQIELFNELAAIYASFAHLTQNAVGAQHEFLCKANDGDLKKIASDAKRAASESFEQVTLLGSDAVEEAAREYWNAATHIPFTMAEEPRESQKFKEGMGNFKLKRAEFTAAAKAHLKNMRN